MKKTVKDGIVYYDKPHTVDYLDFLYGHIGCDLIVTLASADRKDTNDVVAYASDKSKNALLRKIFKTKYNNGEYLIRRHISEVQAYGIV